jgi:hypothetical protein
MVKISWPGSIRLDAPFRWKLPRGQARQHLRNYAPIARGRPYMGWSFISRFVLPDG